MEYNKYFFSSKNSNIFVIMTFLGFGQKKILYTYRGYHFFVEKTGVPGDYYETSELTKLLQTTINPSKI